jgi:hypothetical protein
MNRVGKWLLSVWLWTVAQKYSFWEVMLSIWLLDLLNREEYGAAIWLFLGGISVVVIINNIFDEKGLSLLYQLNRYLDKERAGQEQAELIRQKLLLRRAKLD